MDYLSRVSGQHRAVDFLRTLIEHENLSHAYLFYGPAGVGKMTAAESFAAVILAAEDQAGKGLLTGRVHPDMLIVERLPDKTRLGKDQISKEVQPWLALKPYRARHRLVIIRDAHLLTPEAGNALLKTLEEPPEYAVIILVADEVTLMETILSRCQIVRFQAVAEEDLVAILTEQGIDIEQARCAARLSQGSVAAAVAFAQETGLAEQWNTAHSMVKSLAAGNMAAVFEAAESIEKAPHLLSHMLSTILRDIYVYRSTGNAALLMIAEHEGLAHAFSSASTDRLRDAVGKVQAMQKQLQTNVNPLTLGINMAYAVRDAFWD
ncbi:MAG: ATP-binding protein [Syntrophomonadaceae bacterium]|jgi:DNA polymerase-3 subunit delta'